jgi:hypothetical protein
MAPRRLDSGVRDADAGRNPGAAPKPACVAVIAIRRAMTPLNAALLRSVNRAMKGDGIHNGAQ